MLQKSVLLIVAVPAFLAPTTGCQSLLDTLFPPTDNGNAPASQTAHEAA